VGCATNWLCSAAGSDAAGPYTQGPLPPAKTFNMGEGGGDGSASGSGPGAWWPRPIAQGDDDEACLTHATCGLGTGWQGEALGGGRPSWQPPGPPSPWALTALASPFQTGHTRDGSNAQVLPAAAVPSSVLEAYCTAALASMRVCWPARWMQSADAQVRAVQRAAMASTSAVTARRCREVMRRNRVDDLHGLALHAIDRGVFKPTAVPTVPWASTGAGEEAAEELGAPSSQPDLALALDGSLSSGVWLSHDSDTSVALDLGAHLVPSVVRFALCGPDSNASRDGLLDDTAVRLARIEGSNLSATSGYQDLGPLVAEQPLLHLARGQYLTRAMSRHALPVRWLRIRLPPPHHAGAPADSAALEPPGICLAEIEVHQGEVTRELSSVESGVSSFDLDMDLLHQPHLNDTAYMLKCAAFRLFPVENDILRTEAVLPEQAGVLLSTGNLGDITKDSGNFSSLSVLDDMVMRGSVSLGDPTDAPASIGTLELNSILTEPLRFEGKNAGSGLATVMPEKAGAAWSISLPDATSGSFMTSGELPALQSLSVLSAGSFKQRLDALDHVTLGTALDPQPLRVELPIDGREPLRFAGRLPRDGRQTSLLATAGRCFAHPHLQCLPGVHSFMLAAPENLLTDCVWDRENMGGTASSAAALLMLPDRSGTVQVSSDMPLARRNATFHQHVTSQGGSVFDGQHLRMGSALDSGSALF